MFVLNFELCHGGKVLCKDFRQVQCRWSPFPFPLNKQVALKRGKKLQHLITIVQKLLTIKRWKIFFKIKKHIGISWQMIKNQETILI